MPYYVRVGDDEIRPHVEAAASRRARLEEHNRGQRCCHHVRQASWLRGPGRNSGRDRGGGFRERPWRCALLRLGRPGRERRRNSTRSNAGARRDTDRCCRLGRRRPSKQPDRCTDREQDEYRDASERRSRSDASPPAIRRGRPTRLRQRCIHIGTSKPSTAPGARTSGRSTTGPALPGSCAFMVRVDAFSCQLRTWARRLPPHPAEPSAPRT